MNKFKSRSSQLKTINSELNFSFGAEIKILNSYYQEDLSLNIFLSFFRVKGLVVEWRKLRGVPIDPDRGEWYYLAVYKIGGESEGSRWLGLYLKGYLAGRSDGKGGFLFYGVKDGIYSTVLLPRPDYNINDLNFNNDFKSTFGVDYESWKRNQEDRLDADTSKLY